MKTALLLTTVLSPKFGPELITSAFTAIGGATVDAVAGGWKVTSPGPSFGAGTSTANAPIVSGKIYRVTVTIATSSPQTSVQFNGQTALAAAPRSGTFSVDITASSTSGVMNIITNGAASVFNTFTAISVRRLYR